MKKTLSLTEFSRYCGISRQAANKAVRAGMINLNTEGRVPLGDAVNVYYKTRAYQKALERILTMGEISKGWSALCFIAGRKKHPAVLYGPSGLDQDIEFVEESVEFNPDTGKITVDGVEYQAALVYDGANPPPWFTEHGLSATVSKTKSAGQRVSKKATTVPAPKSARVAGR